MHKIAEIKISYTSNKLVHDKIKSSSEAHKLFLDTWNLKTMEFQEEFKIILLNRANEPLGIYPLSKGGTSSTVVDSKILFSVALKCHASGVILAHNHPSGNKNPSGEDISITKSLIKVGKLLDVIILDHIILTNDGYFSFADSGMMNIN